MKIALVIGSLAMGGSERAALNLASGLIQRGHAARVVAIGAVATPFYTLPPDLPYTDLGLGKVARHRLDTLRNTAGRIGALRRALLTDPPNAVISFTDRVNVQTLLALTGTRIPRIISAREYPNSIGRPLKLLCRALYPTANLLVSVSSGTDAYYGWLPQRQRRVIFNSVSRMAETAPPVITRDPKRRWVISMGRFAYQKNFTLLIAAFEQVAAHYPDWDLVILGDGADRPQLEAQIERAGLSERVMLAGRVKAPFTLLQQAELFAFPTRWEGMPNALLEALACGLPVITTDYIGEPRDVIREGVDGLIVPLDDADGLAEALARLMGDARLRAQMHQHALEVHQRFAPDLIWDQWEQALREVITE